MTGPVQSRLGELAVIDEGAAEELVVDGGVEAGAVGEDGGGGVGEAAEGPVDAQQQPAIES